MKRFCVAVTALLCMLTGCAAEQPLTRSSVGMDTVLQITLYDHKEPALLDACFEQIARYEALFSRTDPHSEVSLLNTAKGSEVPLSQEVCELLACGKAWGERTGGALDITIAPVSALWNFENQTTPPAAALAEAAALVDYRALTVTAEGARLPAGMAVDLGGIAKGYVADRVAAYLREQGVKSALLDLGGNIYALGDKNGTPFTVGIRDPFSEEALAATLQVSDASVVTSGVYERGFFVDGVAYHHLLDPSTGWPVNNGLASVTVVSARSVDGDALSTACFVLGRQEGMALIEQLDGVEALFIDDQGRLYPSSGLVYEER